MDRIRCLTLVYVVLIMVLLRGQGDAGGMVIVKCREREREALLAFKQGLVDVSNSLFTWGSNEVPKQDCCAWTGVYCNNRTGHVIKLDFQLFSHLQGKMISHKLIELQYLRYLDLRGIDFLGSQVPGFIGSLTNLRHLDLSSFGGKFPSQVGNLTLLQYLDLSNNQFSDAENLNWLPRLSSLTYLDLSDINLGNVLDWPETVNKLPKLRSFTLVDCSLASPPVHSALYNRNSSKSLASVDLRFNHLSSSIFVWLSNYNTSLVYLDLAVSGLTGSIPDIFGNMSSLSTLDLGLNQLERAGPNSFARLCSLQTLYLNRNNLSGQISEFVHIVSVGAKNSLQTLDLSSNHLLGSLPNLTNFSSLKDLHLSENKLSGRVPESLGLLSKLEIINFGMNSLEGVISATHFSKLSKLKKLNLSSNSLVLNFSSNWVPPFQLDTIGLQSCMMGPYFPKWLQTQESFSYLDISSARISDNIPSWFWGLCQKLTFLNISHNQIRGSLANFPTFEFSYHPELHLEWNELEGPIPSFLSKATYLDLSNNKISGSISFLCASEAMSLSILNLSSNNLSGELPDCLTHLASLVMLNLSNNSLSGKIPTTIGSLLLMETLKLRSNRLDGELPSSMKNCTSLIAIDLGDNRLWGPIPKWLGVSFQNLVILMLSSNQFNGSMPSHLCQLTHIQILDISVNNISGSIPECINNLMALAKKENSSLRITHHYRRYNGQYSFEVAEYEDEATFTWKGQMYTYKNTLGLMKRIDLSSNRLTGEIPTEITHLVGLISLNLSRNQLTGQIPLEIGKLQSLDAFDLSRNQIDGRIPTGLARINRVSFLDLSYNNLSGKIPIGTQLQGFDSSAYAGNPLLCGLPLQKACDSEETGPDRQTNFMMDKDDLISRGFCISMAFGFVVGFWGVCCSLIFNRTWRCTCFMFLSGLNDWLYVRVALTKRQFKDA